jgi:hypothetical protein
MLLSTAILCGAALLPALLAGCDNPLEAKIKADAAPKRAVCMLQQAASDIPLNGQYTFTSPVYADGSGGATSGVTQFTIINGGNADLVITSILATAGDTADFVISGGGSSTVPAGGSGTFTVVFDPLSTGAKRATVSIDSSDSQRSPYRFDVVGTGAAVPVPSIVVLQGTTPYSNGGSYDFASHRQGSNTDVVFTIKNGGSATLNLTGSPDRVVCSGSGFSVTQQPVAGSLAPGATTTFTVRFTPPSTGLLSTTFSIANNDSGNNPFVLTLQGTGTASSIVVEQGGTPINSGGSYDYGNVMASATKDVVFTIRNTGSASLNLGGYPALSGTNASLFSRTVEPSLVVAAGGSTTFTLRFAPTSLGAKSAMLTISSDDPQHPSDTVNLSGTAVNWHGTKVLDNVPAWYTSIGRYDANSLRIAYYDSTAKVLKLVLSNDGGINWSAPITVDSSGDVGMCCSLWVYTPSWMWISYYDNTNKDLKLARTTNGGASWTITTVDSAGDVGYVSNIWGTSGTLVFIAYADKTNQTLKCAKSTDGGATFPTILTVATMGGAPGNSISDANQPHFVWQSVSYCYIAYMDGRYNDMCVAKSTTQGNSWTGGIANLTDPLTTQTGAWSSMASNGTNLYVCYWDWGDIRFARSTDNSATWPSSSFLSIDTGLGTGATQADLCADAATNNIFVTFNDYTNWHLRFSRSIDAGVTWPVAYRRSIDNGTSSGSSIVASGLDVYVSYGLGSTLKYARSLDGGDTW